MKLRSLVLVTGTLHIEGGSTTKVKSTPSETLRARERMTVVHERVITGDRRGGNTMVSHYNRALRNLRLLRTPWGSLLDPAVLPAFQALMNKAARDVAAFNRASKTCALVNAYVWELLAGKRLAAIEGWLARKIRDRDGEILAAVARLEVAGAA